MTRTAHDPRRTDRRRDDARRTDPRGADPRSDAPISTLRRARLHRRGRAQLEGMTLVEIMIVVIIMALIATGVALAVLPQLDKAKEDTTRTRAATIRSAATLYLAQENSCPSVDELQDENYIQEGTDSTDGWGNPFNIECQRGDITVTSDRFNGETIIEEGN